MEEERAVRKLAMFAFSFSAAVILCNHLLPQTWRLGAAGMGAVLFLLVLVLRKGKLRLMLSLVCAGLSLGFLWPQAYDALFFQPARELDDRTVRLTAAVQDYPQQTDYGWKVPVRMKTQRGTELSVLLYTDEQGESLRPGDRVESVTHLTLGSYSAAGEEITYYTAKGIFLWGQCYGQLAVDRPAHIPVRYWPAHLAWLLKSGIDAVFPEESASLVRAVVTGSRDKLTDEFTSSLERTGLSHTVAVSGMHLSCFAGILALLLGRGKRLTAGLVILWSLVFSGVAGSTPSVTRAAVMIILLQLAPLLGRERDDATALGFALMLLLVWNPYSAAHVGLQLSFASVAGIFMLGSALQTRTVKALKLDRKAAAPTEGLLFGVARAVLSVLCATVGAMAATVPLTAIHFGTVSLIAPLSNLLNLWAVTGVFAAGMLTGALGLFFPALARILAVPVSWLAGYVQWCSGLLSGFPFACLTMDSVYYRGWLLLCYLLVILAFSFRRRRVIVPVCCATVALAACILLTALEFDRGGLKAVVLDVGQGQSVLLRCGEGLVLVDCGGDAADNPGDTAAGYLNARGWERIDILVLTHFHEDHANGVRQLLERIRVEQIFAPDVEPDAPLRQEILAAAEERNIPVHLLEQGLELTFDKGGKLTLYPPMRSGGDANELGLSVLASSGETDILITGDMSGQSEGVLLQCAALPDIELLIAGHHGSKYSTTQELLDVVKPELCAISVGEHNRYGHPAGEVLQRLAESGSEIYRTDRNGTVDITFHEP